MENNLSFEQLQSRFDFVIRISSSLIEEQEQKIFLYKDLIDSSTKEIRKHRNKIQELELRLKKMYRIAKKYKK